MLFEHLGLVEAARISGAVYSSAVSKSQASRDYFQPPALPAARWNDFGLGERQDESAGHARLIAHA